MRFSLFLAAVFISAATLAAQPATATVAPFRTGSQMVGAGIGIANLGAAQLGGQYEIGVGERLGIGYIGVGGLASLYFYGARSFFALGGQANYHFDLNEPRIDLSAGLTLSVGFSEGYNRGASLGLNLAGRYYIATPLALFARVGFGYTVIMAGLDFAL